jgi:hypothetical protein
MSVATGNVTQSTNFYVLPSIPAGNYHLAVIANGIHSEHISVTLA